MIDEADGYVTDVAYTRHHHPTLDPARAVLAARRAGLAPPSMRFACELGFGQGLSLAIHVTAGDTEWWGVDVLPQHVEFARSLIDDAAARERLVCASFEQFDARSDLPMFDFIALHGVWSWISPENRARISTFIDRRLAPGGIVYVGYNALPGWGPALSLRELLVAHANSGATSQCSLEERIGRALEFAAKVVACDPALLASQPQFEKHLRDIRTQKTSYLAHEYFNRDWHPMHFAQVASELRSRGLSYLSQADFSDTYDQWRLTSAQQALLAGIEDPLLRESTRDVILDRQFRRDYWIRLDGALDRAPSTKYEVRLRFRPAVAAVEPSVPTEVSEWLKSLDASGVTDRMVDSSEHAALGYALGRGLVDLVREPAASEESRERVTKLNRKILDRIFKDTQLSVLASHLTGSGIELGWWTLALLSAMRSHDSIEAAVTKVMHSAEDLGIVLSRHDFSLTTDETREELLSRSRLLLARREFFEELLGSSLAV